MTSAVKDLCKRYSVSVRTVLSWIRSGELRAFSVSRRRDSKKPRWRISQEAVEAFEALRSPKPPPPRAQRKQRQADVIQFYS
jgi:excisionase family DNA binding protein